MSIWMSIGGRTELKAASRDNYSGEIMDPPYPRDEVTFDVAVTWHDVIRFSMYTDDMIDNVQALITADEARTLIEWLTAAIAYVEPTPPAPLPVSQGEPQP